MPLLTALLPLLGSALAYITGSPGVGNVLTANLVPSAGTATTWQWTRNGTNIAGATSSTYTQVSADVGTTVAVLINGTYTASISVPAIAPAVTSAPVVSSASTSSPLTWTPGVYTGTPTPTVTAAVFVNGALAASNVTQSSYTPTLVGGSLVVTETATNSGGSVQASSSPVTISAQTGQTVGMTQLDDSRIIQRSTKTGGGQGKGQGSVVVPLTFTGTSPIYARRRSVSDGATIVQAAWQANASATSGNVTLGGIDVPAFSAGAPVAANDGWFYLDVATDPSGPWTSGTSKLNCGRLTAIAGQSLGTRFLGRQTGTDTNASLGVSINPYCTVHATFNNDTINYMPTVSTMPWLLPADGGTYTSTGVSEFLRLECLVFGTACGVIGHTSSGTASSTYWTGNANATQFAAVTAHAGGAWEAQIWHQGHSEAGFGTPPNAYKDSLTRVFSAITAANSFSGYARHVQSIPNIATLSLWGDPYERNRVRLALDSWAAANSARHVCPNDLDLSDGVHPSQVGNITLARHWYRSTRAELSLRGDAGPAVVSATRVGTTITVTLSDVGQGNLVLTGTPANRIWAFPTGKYDTYGNSNNRFPVSSVTVTNKTTLSVVLANDPGDGTVLDLRFYWPNDYTGAPLTDHIRDDQTDGDGITVGRQVLPTFAAISVAAPNSGGAQNNPPATAANVSPFVPTGTSVTYGAQEQTGFGQTLSGGTAAGGASKFPSFGASGRTTECWFTCPTIGALQVLVGYGSGQTYLGITAAGKIASSVLTGTTTLVAGKRYHAALVEGPNGSQLYLTNVTDATAGAREANLATAVATPPGQCTFYLRNNTGSFAMSGGTIDEVCIWDKTLYSGTSYTAPTAPYVGTEADFVTRYPLDGDLTEKVAA